MSGMLEIKMGKAHVFLTLEQKEHDLVLMPFDNRLGITIDNNGRLPPQIVVPAPAPYASLVTIEVLNSSSQVLSVGTVHNEPPDRGCGPISKSIAVC